MADETLIGGSAGATGGAQGGQGGAPGGQQGVQGGAGGSGAGAGGKGGTGGAGGVAQGGQSGAGGDPWYAKLPPELVTDKVKGFKGVEDLVKSHTNLEQAVGRKGILLPKDGSKPEDVAEFRKALGVPEKPEEYDWKAPEGYDAEGMDIKEIATSFHGLHLNKEQFKGVMDFYAAKQKQVGETIKLELVKQRGDTVAALKQEWGDEYDANLKLVQDVAKRTGLGEVFAAAGLGNNLAALKAMREIAKYLPEDSAGGVDAKGADGLRAELEAMKKSPVYLNKLHPGHADLMKRRDEIYRRLYPTK